MNLTSLRLILEMFDKPWSHSPDDDMTRHVTTHIFKNKHKDETFTNIKAHRLEGKNGHLISYVRNGALEAHHVDRDFESGELHSGTEKPNPRFYSTMIHHLKTHALDKGRAARILSPHNSPLSKRYDSVTRKLATKHGHKLEHSVEQSLGHTYNSILIHPIGYKKGLEEHFGPIKGK